MCPTPPAADPRFVSLRRVLRPASPGGRTSEDGAREAAVSLVLRSRDALELLLIKRAQAEWDPWSGHMALPGGRRDASDASLLHTAIRETLEETGVALGIDRHHLGGLSRLEPASRRLPQLTVAPFVFGVPADTDARVASHEVEAVFWVPVSALVDPAAAGTYEHRAGELVWSFPSFAVEEQVVWGLTYRVLDEFLRTARAADGGVLR